MRWKFLVCYAAVAHRSQQSSQSDPILPEHKMQAVHLQTLFKAAHTHTLMPADAPVTRMVSEISETAESNDV